MSDETKTTREEPPRRICIDRMTPAELAVTKAVEEVEALGCDTRLTEAVILLGQARDKIADYVDGVESKKVEEAPPLSITRERLVVALAEQTTEVLKYVVALALASAVDLDRFEVAMKAMECSPNGRAAVLQILRDRMPPRW